MKKILSLILLGLMGFNNFSFSALVAQGGVLPIGDNGCCSHHGGVKYISSEGGVLCADGTLSSCYGTQGSEICEGVSSYTEDDFWKSTWVIKKDDQMQHMFDNIQRILEEYRTIGKKVRAQNGGASERLIMTRVAATESSVKDRYCNSRDAFISLAQGYLIEENIKAQQQYDEIGVLLKNGDNAYNSKRWEDAISYYSKVLDMIAHDLGYAKIKGNIETAITDAKKQLALKERMQEKNREKQDWNELTDLFEKAKEKVNEGMYESALDDYKYILKQEGKVKWGNNYDLVRKNINTIEDILSLQKEKKEVSQKLEHEETIKEIEKIKETLGEKAKMLKNLASVIKTRDEATQQKIKLLLETFKLSNDNYTKNIGFYLSYLLE